MNEARFDALTRWVTSRASRRSALGGTLAAALSAVLDVIDVEAKTCKKQCGPCKKCNKQKGKCRPKKNGTACGEGKACTDGTCGCKSTHFPCGANCCLDGASCLPVLNGAKVCFFGSKQPGDSCDPAKPGQCSSGVCGPYSLGTSLCREAECRAPQRMCNNVVECCSGDCQPAEAACGGGTRCCNGVRGSCQEDCGCCGFPDHVCRKGGCCVVKSGKCKSSPQCCGDLVCHNNECVKP